MRGINQLQSRPFAKAPTGTVEVRSRSRFAVGVVLWRDELSRMLATVVAKATYRLAPGTSDLAELQDPIRQRDEHWGDGSGSLRVPSDLVPFKASHEVVVVGHIYTAGDRPASSATARLVVGDIDKLVEATSPRRSSRTGELVVGAPQSRFSLRYEVAARCLDNPVGVDSTEFAPDGGHVLPQLRPANAEFRPGDYVPLAGLGPVCRSWHGRDSLLRPADREWLLDPSRHPRPQGFDLRYFCAAPSDQRTGEPFHADERLILEGLHPTHPRLVTNLAGVAPMLRAAGSSRPLPPFVADTLYIDTDRRIATLTFRAIVPLADEPMVLDVVASGHVDAMAADATTELERSAVRSNTESRSTAGEGTTELDRDAFNDAALAALPFPSPSEAGRRPAPTRDDGALPFRMPSQPPSAPQSVPAPLPPSSRPPARPQLVGAVPPKVEVAPPSHVDDLPAPAAPSSTFGLSRILPPPEPRSEAKDSFRKAFGAQPDGAKAASDAALALDGLKAVAKAASEAAFGAGARAGGSAALVERVGAPRRAIVDLIALDAGVAPRLRRSKTYAPLLVVPTPPRTHKQVDLPAAESSQEERARADALRVLSCGTPLGPDELNAGFDALLEDPHDFDIPLFLVEGEVKPTMDELETLRVAVELAKPLAGGNKRVQGALATATDALARSAQPLADQAIMLYRQLEAATGELSLPSRHFADLVDRTLLESRSYKKRTLLGEPRIRAELTHGRLALPLYLPESTASQLPLLPTFSLAALVELRPREDASESSPAALVAFALGRVLRARK